MGDTVYANFPFVLRLLSKDNIMERLRGGSPFSGSETAAAATTGVQRPPVVASQPTSSIRRLPACLSVSRQETQLHIQITQGWKGTDNSCAPPTPSTPASGGGAVVVPLLHVLCDVMNFRPYVMRGAAALHTTDRSIKRIQQIISDYVRSWGCCVLCAVANCALFLHNDRKFLRADKSEL